VRANTRAGDSMATFTTPMRLRWPVRARDRLKDLGARRPSLNHLQRRQINSAADSESCARSTRSSWGVPLLATSSAPRPGRTTRSGPLRYASLVCRAPAALMGFAPFAGLLPQSGGWRVSALAGPTCRWLHATSRTVSRDRFRRGRSRRPGATDVGQRRPVERSAIRDASASGLRLPSAVRRRRHETGGRDPALGFSPLSGLPGAHPRAHARDSSHHRAVTSLRNPFGLPSAHGFRRRSFPRCATTFIGV